MFKLFANLISLHLDEERARLAHAEELLEEVVKGELRDQFIAVLGHDLRTPLSAVASSAILLGRITTDSKVVELAERIRASSKRMAALIDDVLDLARGRLGGGIPIHAADVEDLGQALRDVVEELRCVHPSRRLDSRIEISVGIRCDRSRIQQLVTNLLSNALTHGCPTSPVTVAAETIDGDLLLTVTNQGPPIPPHDISQVFKPFWRDSASAARSGLGLGLFICAEIVKAHDGTLEVRSTLESGTTFAARLPGVPPHKAGIDMGTFLGGS
jgi:signal transduction histidine kinase